MPRGRIGAAAERNLEDSNGQQCCSFWTFPGSRPPLERPCRGPLLPEEAPVSPEALLRYDAVRLFVERARAAWPQFEITPSNAAQVGRLCRRLDGLPLALELAAVRLRAFTVDQILQQLDQRFRLLSTGRRTCSVRHQSLRAAIDWSFALQQRPQAKGVRRPKQQPDAGWMVVAVPTASVRDERPSGRWAGWRPGLRPPVAFASNLLRPEELALKRGL